MDIDTKGGVVEQEILRDLFDISKEEIERFVKEEEKSVVLDFEKIKNYLDPETLDLLLNEPENFFKQLSIYFTERLQRQTIVRIKNLPPELRYIRIRDVRSEHKDKLIQIEGIIKISSEVRPYIVKTKYMHEECGGEFWIENTDFIIKKPTKCPVCGGTKPRFIEEGHETIDIQRLFIEEPADQIEKGEQPAQITIMLKQDLCEPKMERKTLPGVRIKVFGILKELRSMNFKALLELYVDAVYIETVDKDIEDIQISIEDENKIKELAKSGDILNLIAQSIAAGLYGKQYDHIKKAITLQLVSGGKRRSGVDERKNLHILLVGDPGVGKSKLLRYIASIAPKSKYVVGITASSVGLTASVRKDEILKGGWVLEAGALVLTSGGIVCIDELDKLDIEEMQSLHEAMEQQTITIDKANIHATLRTEASILAAANPKFGRWDNMKGIVDQINLPPTIINRFDLIFVLIDEPNEQQDEAIVSEIIKGIQEEERPALDKELIRKYIIYAKKIEPTWTNNALEIVKQFYKELRSRSSRESIPITARQLMSIIRLSEASAKIRLSPVVTEDDVNLAKELLIYSLREVGINPETNKLDIDIIMSGISSTQRQKLSKITDIIRDLQKDFPDGVPLSEILNESKKYNFEENRVKEVIDKLLKDGYLYETGPQKYKVV
ncbi:minichromosome maintenance protein MCM [Nanobdella aerobiophila]|nr:minichromosome maintenance protein MCM [Nanobdella aerobiophila]